MAWRSGLTPLALSLVAAMGATSPSRALPAKGRFERLTILAPSSSGGGWDQTARAMERALLADGLTAQVDVVNSPGAGGTIGLAQFLGARKGDGEALLVGGLTMVNAVRANRATVSLDDTTPIARLTGEYEVVAVPAGSELRSLDDVVQALRVNPGSMAWAGGSGGGTDQLLISGLARAIGVEPVRMSYVPFTGGGEVAAALVSHQVAVGVSGYGELLPEIQRGRIRALAVSAEGRLPGFDVPTLREQGIDLVVVNWRGVFAPPGLTDAQRERLAELIGAMAKGDAWRAQLRQYRWNDLYLGADAFARFVKEEERAVKSAPDPRGTTSAERPGIIWTSGMRLLRNRNALGATGAGLALFAVALIAWQRTAAARREKELEHRLEALQEDNQRRSEQTQELLRGLSDQIEKQFHMWALTGAEREVGLLMLKGLRHKEIASLRGTSERTVRQQALTIYKKAGLDGRTDLAAFFLEDLLQPVEAPPQRRSA